MSRALIFMYRTDPYPSKQTRNPTCTWTPPKFWPVPGPKNGNVYFASWGKRNAGVIVPLAVHDWLKWSHDNLGSHDVLNWPWLINGSVRWTSVLMFSMLASC